MKPVTRLVVWLLMSVALPGVAHAQGGDCRSPQPPSVGVAVGRSSPYLDLAPGVVELPTQGAVAVGGGVQFAGRGDLTLTGPLRLRIEGATARWDVRQRTYGPDGSTTSDTSAGHMSARHLVALAGIRTGRAPVCAHVSAGGGIYALGFRGASARRAGAAVGAGIEIPTGGRGVIQVDAVLHIIGTRENELIASSAVPVLNLLVGWAYRF